MVPEVTRQRSYSYSAPRRNQSYFELSEEEYTDKTLLDPCNI